jgi:hypothetical protein
VHIKRGKHLLKVLPSPSYYHNGGFTMKEHNKQKSYYIREYTLRDKSTKSIRVEPWRSFKEEMKVLGITDNDIFQIQLIKNVYEIVNPFVNVAI